MGEKKYVFVNGVMKLNPKFKTGDDQTTTNGNEKVSASASEPVAAPAPTSEPTPASAPAPEPAPEPAAAPASAEPAPAPSSEPLQIISSFNDFDQASDAQTDATGVPMQLADSTVQAMQHIQDDDYASQFNIGTADSNVVLDGLAEAFVQYEVPIGMINKLQALADYRLNFIIDDSGSMKETTDVLLEEGTPFILRGEPAPHGAHMTRWQEAENRLHILIDILAYVPFKFMTIRFLTAKNIINLSREGKTIEQFKHEGHDRVIDAFSKIDVKYKTPTHRVLTKAFEEAAQFPDPTMHYLFTDGVPTDQPVEAVAQLIKDRPNPERNPLTLMSCTNEDAEVEWMKQIEESAPFTAEIDDYQDEKREVLHDQGTAFPYTRGFWIISSLVAAINPDDLDAMDENLPFSKFTLDDMFGRTHTPEEYQYYFERNPHARLYVDLYPAFLNEKRSSRSMVSQAEKSRREAQRDASGGYLGYFTGAVSTIFGFTQPDLSATLLPHTQAASELFRQTQQPNPDTAS